MTMEQTPPLHDQAQANVLPPPVQIRSLAGPPPIQLPGVLCDESDRVAQDVPCKSCGYNLRGLPLSADCPECGTSVQHSARGDWLHLSDPKWLNKLSQGSLLAIIGFFGGIVIVIGTVFVVLLAGVGGIPAGMVQGIVAGIGFAIAAVSYAGYWLMTTPDPASAEQAGGVNVRVIARYGMLATLAAAPLQHLANPRGFMSIGPNAAVPATMKVLIAASIAATLGALVGQFAFYMYMARLANRIPKPSLAHQATIVRWGLLASQSLSILMMVAMLLGMRQMAAAATTGAMGGWFFGFMALSCIAGPLALIFAIWSIVLLFQLRGQFSRAAAQARMIWNHPQIKVES